MKRYLLDLITPSIQGSYNDLIEEKIFLFILLLIVELIVAAIIISIFVIKKDKNKNKDIDSIVDEIERNKK